MVLKGSLIRETLSMSKKKLITFDLKAKPMLRWADVNVRRYDMLRRLTEVLIITLDDIKELSPNELNGYLQAIALKANEKKPIQIDTAALRMLGKRSKFIRKDVASMILPFLYAEYGAVAMTGFNMLREPITTVTKSSKAHRFFESLVGHGEFIDDD